MLTESVPHKQTIQEVKALFLQYHTLQPNDIAILIERYAAAVSELNEINEFFDNRYGN